MAAKKKIKWACPKCGATPDAHGRGPCETRYGECLGFLCECACDTADDHGEHADDPCASAACYHCGWAGTFPVPAVDPKKLKGWAKQAWTAGWRPPLGWRPA